jgi:hypothetical protein
MCVGCNGIQWGDPSAGHFTGSNSATKSSGTQGVYNTTDENTNAKPFTDGNGAQSHSGSVSESGLGPSSSNQKYEMSSSSGANNSKIGQQGFGS